MEKLTAAEQALLEVFNNNKGIVLSHERLLNAMPSNNFRRGGNDANLIAVHMRTLRKKLKGAKIESVRGVGYKMI